MRQLLEKEAPHVFAIDRRGDRPLPPFDVLQIARSDKLNHFIAYGVPAVFALYRCPSWIGAMVVVAGILGLIYRD